MTDIIVKDIKNGSEYYYGGSAEVAAEDVSYDNSSSGATADNIQDAMDEVFQSVSNGKELIADAITDKGVQTSATDSFQTMAENISTLPSKSTGEDYLFSITTDAHSYTSTNSHKSVMSSGMKVWDYFFNNDAYVAIRCFLCSIDGSASDRYSHEEIFYKKPGVQWLTSIHGSSNYGSRQGWEILKKGNEFKTIYWGMTEANSGYCRHSIYETTINSVNYNITSVYKSADSEAKSVGQTIYNNKLNSLTSDGWEAAYGLSVDKATYSQTSGSGTNYYTKITVSTS